MPRILGGPGLVLEEAVLDDPYDPRIEVLDDVKGKSKKKRLLDLDLTKMTLFPQMNIDVFCEMDYGSTEEVQFILKEEFMNLFHSTIMNLWDLLVLGTTGEVS
jgi:hypothetical protein